MMAKAMRLTAMFLFILPLIGCETPSGGQEGDTSAVTDPQFDPAFTVCNPFNDEASAANRGIVGQLKYLTPDQPRYSRAVDYIDYGTPIETTIFFNRLFVPTRPFDRGFLTETGQEILTSNGDTLYEYFGLDLKAQVKLGQNDAPGFYQMALLADDGAVLSVETESGEQILVDDDGTHPTKMGCAATPLYIGAGQKVPIRVRYYQGPRYHISLVVMMRPWPADNSAETVCGQSGNSKFFDSTQNPPKPSATFYGLLSRGWKVLENDNFALPDNIANNPCTPAEETLMISGVAVADILQTTATVTWTTNINSDSKVVVTNVSTGTTMTLTDSLLGTAHSIALSGLSSNTLYSVVVTSVSPGGQTVSASEYAFRTRR